MIAIIDEDLCTGCGLCVDTCPEVFKMDGDLAAVIGDVVPSAAETACLQAVDGCPTDAITTE